MKVLYSSTYLATGGLQGASGVNWNGQQVNDEAAFFRAAALSYFPRGNRSTKFGFGVNLSFNSEADALLFAAVQFNALPQQADLTILDEGGTVAIVLADAVLESVVPQVSGVYVFIKYEFGGGVWASTSVPPNPTEDTVKRGQVALAVNDESKVVTFDTPFGSTPVTVNCWAVPPSTASMRFIQAVPLYDTITTTGFSAAIAFPIPETGWFLMWEAIAS